MHNGFVQIDGEKMSKSLGNSFFVKDALSVYDGEVSKVVIWGRGRFLDAMKRADELNIPIFFIEDGFIRSISLGLDFAQSYSIVLDSKGIYFDTNNIQMI